jgi:hypothetical protein
VKNGVFWDVTPCGACKNRRNIPEDAIVHSYRRENLKSYTVLCVLLCFGPGDTLLLSDCRWLLRSEFPWRRLSPIMRSVYQVFPEFNILLIFIDAGFPVTILSPRQILKLSEEPPSYIQAPLRIFQ